MTSGFVGNYSEQGGYFGLPLLALLGFLAVSRREEPAIRLGFWMLLITAVFSLGPSLHFLGYKFGPAPWRLIFWLPFFGAMLPGRFVLFSWGAVALMIAIWLASPARNRLGGFGRYAVLAFCLVFVIPDRGYDHVWSRLETPSVLTQPNVIPAGSNILILPYFGKEMGYQYDAGMKFRLVSQGYIGGAAPQDFLKWPLYWPLWLNEFAKIDPVQFRMYLADYGTQYVVVLNRGFTHSIAAEALLSEAGWVRKTGDASADVFTPGPDALPSRAEIDAYLAAALAAQKAADAAAHRAKLIRTENHRVCQIRRIAHQIGLDPAPFMRFYVARVQPPLQVESIVCGP